MIQHVLANKAAHVVVEPQAAMCATPTQQAAAQLGIHHRARRRVGGRRLLVRGHRARRPRQQVAAPVDIQRDARPPAPARRVPSLTPEDLRARVAPHGPFSRSSSTRRALSPRCCARSPISSTSACASSTSGRRAGRRRRVPRGRARRGQRAQPRAAREQAPVWVEGPPFARPHGRRLFRPRRPRPPHGRRLFGLGDGANTNRASRPQRWRKEVARPGAATRNRNAERAAHVGFAERGCQGSWLDQRKAPPSYP